LVIEDEKEKKKERLMDLWMGSNLAYKGIKEVLDSINVRAKKEEISVKEVNSEWRRLSSFMRDKV